MTSLWVTPEGQGSTEVLSRPDFGQGPLSSCLEGQMCRGVSPLCVTGCGPRCGKLARDWEGHTWNTSDKWSGKRSCDFPYVHGRKVNMSHANEHQAMASELVDFGT